MRLAILERISVIRQSQSHFTPAIMKWKNVRFNNVHVSEIPYGDYEAMSEYTDEELVSLFELIVRQANKMY